VKKFSFPLEGVSKLRERAVRDRELALARAHEELAEAEQAQRASQEELRRAVAHAPAGTIVHVRHLLELDAERRRLRADLLRKERRVESTHQKVVADRDQLVAARREAQVVERLRERRYLEFLRACLREEQKQTDEVAGRRHRTRSAA